MGGRALIIGGNGQVGRAAAAGFAAAGWATTVLRRGTGAERSDVETVQVDRSDDAAMDGILSRGFDAVVDLVAFNAAHAAQLTRNAGKIGSAVLLSSAAVYVDAQGRSLQAVRDRASAPCFDGRVSEAAGTVAPDHDSYAGRKRAAELALLDSGITTTVIRPAAIHGVASPQPREWFYVRRVLDGRRQVVLGFGGRSSLHPVSAGNLARMIVLAAKRPGDRVLNAGDPGCPDEAEIAGSIAAAMGWRFDIVRLPGAAPVATPWSLPTPFFLAIDKAEKEIGFEPVETYRQAVPAEIDWLVAQHRAGTLQARLSPRFGPADLGCQVFIGGDAAPFDYAAEDRALADLPAAS